MTDNKEKKAEWVADENGVFRLMCDGKEVAPIKPEDVEETIQDNK